MRIFTIRLWSRMVSFRAFSFLLHPANLSITAILGYKSDSLAARLSGEIVVPRYGASSSITSPKSLSSSSIATTSGPIATSGPKSPSSTSKTSKTTTTISSSLLPSTSISREAALPAYGQPCFNNMLAQYSTLGCAVLDAYCLCNNVDFSNGLRDCSNGACGTAIGSTAIAFGSTYCSSAQATQTATDPAAALSSCGQVCFNNMLAQYSSLRVRLHHSYCYLSL